MNNYQDKYKRKPGGSNDAVTGRMMRACLHEERRRVNRAAHFSRYRDVSPSPEKQVPEAQVTTSLDARLRRWKLEKELKKKMDQQKKKPVFKVGVVHHHFYSPAAKERMQSNQPCHSRGGHKVKSKPTPPKRITRATQKRLEAKKAAAASATPAPSNNSSTRRAPPSTQTKTVPSARKVPASFAPQTYAFKGPTGIKSIPMFGRFAISRESFAEREHSRVIETSEETPRPAQDNIPVVSPLKNRNSLVRQTAVERLSFSPTREKPSKASPIKDNTKINELAPKTDATECQPVEDVETPVLETPPRAASPSPAMFSPYITTSRGKDSARRERRSKLGIGRTPPDDVPTKDTVMKSLNISVEEEERTAQYFKFILQREIERLNELCKKWEKVKSEPDLTEDAHYLINQAIGQTTLLVRKKFERFRSLVSDCETGKGEMLVQCRDLQGFWDMTYVEVKNCDSRFQKLEEVRSNGWIENEVVVTTKRPTAIRKKATNKFTVNAKSSARSWILAKRKKMSQSEENGEDVIMVRDNSEESRPAISGSTTTSTPREKTRRSVGSSPRIVTKSGKRASLKITPKNTPASLLKKVQLSETKKNIRSPLTVMKISKLCKTPDVRLDDTISYVNSDQTPGRGILKKSEETSTTDVAVGKSSRKVDFNDDVVSSETRIDENLENSIDLGRALARIESYDPESDDEVFGPDDVLPTNITLRRVEKRLDFENESISETENSDTAESSNVVAATPSDNFAVPAPLVVTLPLITARSPSTSEDNTSTTKTPRRSSRIAELPSEESHSEDESSTRRVLRNRTVPMSTPKKNSRRSIKSPSTRKTLGDLDSSTKENDDPQIPTRKTILSEPIKIVVGEYDYKKPEKIRRSTRKSVRFNAEDCTACADSIKPVHPMTPHSRRSRKISLLGDDVRPSVGPSFDGDLISFDSPKTVPSRIRRTGQFSKKTNQ